MITLGTRNVELENFDFDGGPEPLLVSEDASLPYALRKERAFVVRNGVAEPGFRTYIIFHGDTAPVLRIDSHARVVRLPDDYRYLEDGDIVRITPRTKTLRTLYRKKSRQNFILTTERCNNHCLMCSQPPKTDDDSWLIADILRTIPLIDRSTPELTLTGGEPTLLGVGFITIVSACKSWLPNTAIHILSNGRMFSEMLFARRYAAIAHPDIMVGIPLYSDVSTLHDYVVQAPGAYDDTIRGILNLKMLRQRVEIRVVLHKQTYERLPQLADFIARNLRFVDQVVLMGLEMTGFTRANLPALWIDPIELELPPSSRTRDE